MSSPILGLTICVVLLGGFMTNAAELTDDLQVCGSDLTILMQKLCMNGGPDFAKRSANGK